MRTENSLNSIKNTYDLYNDLCGDLAIEIEDKKVELDKLNKEIAKSIITISKLREEATA